MKGRVTIITGGSGGIGSEVARALAEAGSDIAIWYMKSTKAEKLANSIARQYSVRCKAYQCDVSKHEQVKNTIEAVVRDFGRLDVMIANAGIPSKAGGLDDTLDAYHRVVDVDFHGAYYCAREAGKIFRKQKSGNIIFTASMSGHAVNVPQQQVRILLLPHRLFCSHIPGLLQCMQSRRNPPLQVSGSRTGRAQRTCQFCQSWLHRH